MVVKNERIFREQYASLYFLSILSTHQTGDYIGYELDLFFRAGGGGEPDGAGCQNAEGGWNLQNGPTKECLSWGERTLTTRATPPLEISVAHASIRTHCVLFNRPRNQNDSTAFDGDVESREWSVIPGRRPPSSPGMVWRDHDYKEKEDGIVIELIDAAQVLFRFLLYQYLQF